VSPDGALTILDADGRTAAPGAVVIPTAAARAPTAWAIARSSWWATRPSTKVPAIVAAVRTGGRRASPTARIEHHQTMPDMPQSDGSCYPHTKVWL